MVILPVKPFRFFPSVLRVIVTDPRRLKKPLVSLGQVIATLESPRGMGHLNRATADLSSLQNVASQCLGPVAFNLFPLYRQSFGNEKATPKTGFFTTFVKTQGKNNSPKSITQGNFCPKTQPTGSIFSTTTKNSTNW